MDLEKIDTRRIGIEILVIPMFITGILVIFTNFPIVIISGISFLLGIIIAVVDFLSKLEKPSLAESSAPETPAQKTETKSYAGTAIKVIATAAIAIIVIYVGLAGYNHFFSGDSSGKNSVNKGPVEFTQTIKTSQVTQNPDGSVTITANANVETETEISYKKGQKITFTATGEATSTANSKDDAYGKNGPAGWTNGDPSCVIGRKKFLQSAPFMSAIGKLGKNGKWFYIGTKTTITAETSGKTIYFVTNDALIDKKGNKHPEWILDNIGSFSITVKIQ